MEPSIITIPIDNKIKVKKSEVMLLKDTKTDVFRSKIYRVCDISNIKYHLTICPYEKTPGDNVEKTLFSLWIEISNASAVDVKVECIFESTKFSHEIKHTFKYSCGLRGLVCATSDFFDEKNKFFVGGEMILRLKGTFKITFPSAIFCPISAQWKIKESHLSFLKTLTIGSKITKELKLSSNIKLTLEICPHNNNENVEHGNAWIFLHFKGSDMPIMKAVLNLLIASANYSYDIEEECQLPVGVCISTVEELFKPENQYFVDGEMTVKVTGALMIEKKKAECKAVENVEANINQALHGEPDFTIVVKDDHIRVHKHVLETASPYFVGMFCSGMIEATKMETTITDFSYEVIAAGIKLIYNASEFPTHFSFEQMLDLLQFSDKYDIQIIKDRVQDYLIENLSPMNVCPLIKFTTITVLSATKLFTKCQEYLIKCSKESTAVHGLDTVDKNLLLQILMGTFIYNFKTF